MKHYRGIRIDYLCDLVRQVDEIIPRNSKERIYSFTVISGSTIFIVESPNRIRAFNTTFGHFDMTLEEIKEVVNPILRKDKIKLLYGRYK